MPQQQEVSKKSCINIHAAKGSHDLATAKYQASANEYVGRQAVEEIRSMCNLAMSGHENLRESVCTSGISLDLDGDEREEENLERSHCSIPHGTANPIAICERGGRQEGGRPGPGGHDASCYEARFDTPGCCIEFLTLTSIIHRVSDFGDK
jgi:hypothetical protein